MDYLNNSWAPVSHKILKDSNLRDIVDNEGLKKLNIVDNEALNALTKLFEEFHRVDDKRGGMFYSVYSKDINYRKQINKAIISILAPIFEFLFSDYRVVLASFVVKYPGPMSEFALHQDGTGVDELNFSAVSLWIPLQDVDINNGAMALIPYSHHFFSPYRHISIPTPFDKIQSRVKEYLQIQSVKKGEVLVFDNRLIHSSVSNNSDEPRVAIVCAVVPKEAKLITCFKANYNNFEKLELIENEDEFLLEHTNFLENCHYRPTTGRSLGFVEDKYNEISEKDFILLCKKYQLKESKEVKWSHENNLNLIGEPIHSFVK